MTDIAIRVENLSKQYRIGGPQARYKTIRESLTAAVQAPFRRLSSVVRGQSSAVSDDTIWALKDVSFEVKQGEVVGIIGRNGSGKTTLLKILSRITEPTEGHAEIHGRVGSLLEVGTGFHPELTGRENITLNGAILGMKRVEIDRKFDEIVDFAEIEKFIDTPVKHYSSGMYVRLAFAVAAHLEPEILLVDEVLAVGDAAFQKKCLGKMGDVAKEGRTVLFVSHNMAAIQALCSRALCLKCGCIDLAGSTEEVVGHYLDAVADLAVIPLRHRKDRRGDGPLRFTSVSFESEQGDVLVSWPCGKGGVVVLSYESNHRDKITHADLGFSATTSLGQPLFQCFTKLVPEWLGEIPACGQARCHIPSLNIKPGVYILNVYAQVNNRVSDWVQEGAQLTVVENDFFGSGRLPKHSSFMLLSQDWKVARFNPDE